VTRAARAAAGVAALLALGACGSGGDAAPTTTTRARGDGACETLTRAQAATVVGRGGTGAATGTPERSASCRWRGPGGATLDLTFARTEGPAAPRVAGAPGEAVAVGDAARVESGTRRGRPRVVLVAAVGEVLVTADATGARVTPTRVAAVAREAIAYANR
jgi:hypothetical protein